MIRSRYGHRPMWLVLKILAVFAVIWWWLLAGSRSHCPRCGVDLEEDYGVDSGIRHTYTRNACACGWRRDG